VSFFVQPRLAAVGEVPPAVITAPERELEHPSTSGCRRLISKHVMRAAPATVPTGLHAEAAHLLGQQDQGRRGASPECLHAGHCRLARAFFEQAASCFGTCPCPRRRVIAAVFLRRFSSKFGIGRAGGEVLMARFEP